ncbi:helix-turn-helix domain-containing protein [Streptomyces sp. NPDC093225]|uniref:AraC-like ligand-binding domain-containing protein n=1 Tax=Streptomyces sp. NPDC093225 TaxID=3366034 RepID=UPI0037F7BC72
MSTDPLPATDRFEWFTDLVARELIPVGLRSQEPVAFQAEAAALDLGAVRVSRFSHTALVSRRTPAHIRRGDPEQYQLALVRRNPMWINQNRGESGLLDGDLVLWDTSRPQEAGAMEGARRSYSIILQMPRTALPLPGDKVDRLLAHRISGRHGMGALLADFMNSLTRHAPDCGPAELGRLGTVAVDLAAACLAQQLDAADELPPETRNRALLKRIDSFIDHHLADPDLDPAAIAARHNISVRTLHQLFRDRARREPGGPGSESVAAAVRSRRLERCRADLARPELADRPVHAIAAHWGLPNAAAFSRSFRAAYGQTPTEFRALNGKESCALRTASALPPS